MKYIFLIVIIVCHSFADNHIEKQLSGEWLYLKSIYTSSDSSSPINETNKEKHILEFVTINNQKLIKMCHTGEHTSPDQCKKDCYEFKVENNQLSFHRVNSIDFSIHMTFELLGDTLVLEAYRAWGTPIHPSVMYKDVYVSLSKLNEK